MARLCDVRTAILTDSPVGPVVGVLSDEDTTPDDGEDWCFDDDDFWNAIDLMETSYKSLRSLLASMRMAPGRRRLLENHCDDLKQFIDEFQYTAEAEDK